MLLNSNQESADSLQKFKSAINLQMGSNICVVTAYDDAFAEVGDFTTTVKAAYCLKHHYDFRVYREGFDPSRHPSWSKLLFIREILKEYEWVFWIDADAVFTNHNKKITDLIMLGGDFFICKEYHNVPTLFNMGVFLIHRGEWSFGFIEQLWGTDKWWWDGYWEQSRFSELMGMNVLGQRVVYFMMRTFNSAIILKEQICCGNKKTLVPDITDERAWQAGDYIAHRLSGSVGEKKRDLEDCLTKSGWKLGV